MPSPLRHTIHAFLAVTFAAAAASPSRAADVDVLVTDAAGKPLAGAVVTVEALSGAAPVKPMAGIEVSQAKRMFNPQVTVVTIGTPVTFPNFDTVRHHVYSFSPAKTFELKLYAGVPNAPILFDKAGIVTVGCNIHDHMSSWIAVVDTPLFAISADGGRAHVAGVAAGTYRLRVWHPGLGADAAPVVLPIKVGATGLEQAVRMDVTFNPLGKQA